MVCDLSIDVINACCLTVVFIRSARFSLVAIDLDVRSTEASASGGIFLYDFVTFFFSMIRHPSCRNY